MIYHRESFVTVGIGVVGQLVAGDEKRVGLMLTSAQVSGLPTVTTAKSPAAGQGFLVGGSSRVPLILLDENQLSLAQTAWFGVEASGGTFGQFTIIELYDSETSPLPIGGVNDGKNRAIQPTGVSADNRHGDYRPGPEPRRPDPLPRSYQSLFDSIWHSRGARPGVDDSPWRESVNTEPGGFRGFNNS